MTRYCPRCGQRVLLRLGVYLSPRRADVFDAIKRQSKYGGIRSDTLAGMFGGEKCVRVHISHINSLLAPVGWRIVCDRQGSAKGFYRVVKRRQHDHVDRLLGIVPRVGMAAADRDRARQAESSSAD